MAKKMIRREFRESDLAQIIEFKKQSAKTSFIGQKLKVDRFVKRLNESVKKDPGMIRVLESDGAIAGYIWVGLSEGDFGKYGFLHQLFIHQDFRGRGLAQTLVKDAEKYLAKRGAKKMEIMVTGTNCSAYKLYKKLKYKDTRIQMEKAL
jgi:ribosomal protein S18 acetylase RimI-like enzyme